MSEHGDWAALPDDLLHSVVALLGSFHDLLAFAATCRPWRSAFSSYPAKSTLYTLFPPLLLQPDVSFCSPRSFQDVNFVPTRPCHVTDLASQDAQLCSQIPLLTVHYANNSPPSALDRFTFRGAAFGHMIFCDGKSCLVFDVFTGVCVPTPPLPVGRYYYSALTAPLASPNSHLIVAMETSNFFWRVGGNSWFEFSPYKDCHPASCIARNGIVENIVVFKGQVFGMDYYRRLFMVHLTPQVRIQEIPVAWGGSNSITQRQIRTPWMVACGDLLLMVGCGNRFPSAGDVFEAYRLDMSAEPAKWVKVDRLDNWAVFVSTDERSQPLSCMNPERWGGRSNCLYFHYSGHWLGFELGKPLQQDAIPGAFIYQCRQFWVEPMWVVPSMFSLCCGG